MNLGLTHVLLRRRSYHLTKRQAEVGGGVVQQIITRIHFRMTKVGEKERNETRENMQ